MAEWLKGCEICNAGLVAQVDKYVDSGLSVNKACKLMSEEGQRKIGELVYSQTAIMARYRLHKNLRDPHPNKKVCHCDKQKTKKIENKSNNNDLALNDIQRKNKNELIQPANEELSANHHVEIAKASAEANRPKESELEKAFKTIKKTAYFLERIIEGDLEDNGTYEDKLFADSIKRLGPSIIISFYQLGIDPEKAIKFYKGDNENGKKTIVKRDLRIKGNVKNNR